MLGAPVACTDGKCGVLHSLVVDPGLSALLTWSSNPSYV